MTSHQPHQHGVAIHTFLEIEEALHAEREPQPSRPTPAFGAPHIGTDHAWNWGSQPLTDCANSTDPTSEGATP